jgi:hypothetical protein
MFCVLHSSWLCQVLSCLRKQRPVTPNAYVKIAASNLVLADGRPYQRPRQDLHPEERLSLEDAACPCPAYRGLPPLNHMRGRCTSMPHGRPAH